MSREDLHPDDRPKGPACAFVVRRMVRHGTLLVKTYLTSVGLGDGELAFEWSRHRADGFPFTNREHAMGIARALRPHPAGVIRVPAPNQEHEDDDDDEAPDSA